MIHCLSVPPSHWLTVPQLHYLCGSCSRCLLVPLPYYFPLASFISSSLVYCPLVMLSHSLPVTLFQCFTNPLPHSCTQCTTLLRPPPPLFCPTVLSHCLAVPLLTTVQYSTVQSQYFTATNSQRHLSTVSLSLFHFPTLPLPLCFLAHHLTY